MKFIRHFFSIIFCPLFLTHIQIRFLDRIDFLLNKSRIHYYNIFWKAGLLKIHCGAPAGIRLQKIFHCTVPAKKRGARACRPAQGPTGTALHLACDITVCPCNRRTAPATQERCAPSQQHPPYTGAN